jgi:hypothetical protein
MKKTLLTMLITFLLSAMMSGLASAQTDEGYVPVPKNKDSHPAYITDMYTDNGKTYIVADYIQWYEGHDANQIFAEREPDSGLPSPPDGYYIVNDNPRLRTFEVKGDAEIIMQIYNRTGKIDGTSIAWNESISLTPFKKTFDTDQLLKQYPYHLIVKDGKIVKIIQQYIP